MTGTITRVVKDKGFGFIKCDEDGKDYFFHKSAINTNWNNLCNKLNDRAVPVEFVEEDSPKGKRAANIKLL